MSAFQLPSPVLLSSGCSVALGNNAAPDMTKLSYPFRKAVLIDEIRFDLWADDQTNGQINLGAFLRAKFQLGQHYLMRDPVPVWLLGTLMDVREEQANDAYLATPQVISHYRWRLPEPLFVQAGEVLRPVFDRVSILGNRPAGNVSVQVSYAGRVVPPKQALPKTIAIPYVGVFVTSFTPVSAQVYQQSNENHLFNPFDQPIRVQRLTGRLFQNAAATPQNATSERGLTPSTAGSALTIQIDDSWGGKVVNDLTGPGDVFDTLRAAWTVDTIMPDKGQYNVKVWNIPANQQLHVGMIAVREEAL